MHLSTVGPTVQQTYNIELIPAIQVLDLRRVYHGQTGVFRKQTKEIVALDSISFNAEPGELFGLIGPNGAGKTTTIKILTTLLLPTSGTAKVLGLDVTRHEHDIRRHIGFMLGGERGLYWRLSAKDNLRYFADLYNVAPRKTKRLIPELLELVGLEGRGDEKVQGYSRGMKQRLHIARMLISNPDVLFLDEPTIGMDPIGARQMRETIQALKQLGKTIVLTTHAMNEAETLCDRIAIIDHGRIIALDTPVGLKSQVADLSITEFELFGTSAEVDRRLEGLQNKKTLRRVVDDHFFLTIQTDRGVNELPGLAAVLDGICIGKITVREPTLEDVYQRLIGGVG